MKQVNKAIDKLSHFGFVGPNYIGLRGKLRLIFQEIFVHKEIILIAEPDFFQLNPQKMNQDVSIKIISSYEEFKSYVNQFENVYYIHFVDIWPRYFNAGEKLILAFELGVVAGFGWIIEGSNRNERGTYYTKLLEGEYYTYREGVFPDFRGRKIHSTMKFLILKYLFKGGAKRVYVDVFKDNTPSLKSQLNAGFKFFAEITVANIPFSSRKIITFR